MKNIGQILSEKGLINDGQLEKALESQKATTGLLGEVLVELGFITEEVVLNCLCEQLSEEYQSSALFEPAQEIAAGELEIPTKVQVLIPTNVLIKCRAIPIEHDEQKKEITVGMVDPGDLKAISELSFASNSKIVPKRIRPHELEAMWQKYYRIEDKVSQGTKVQIADELRTMATQATTETSVIRLVDTVVAKAISLGTSDIHFDVHDNEVIIRFRIDGVLFNVLLLPTDIYSKILARIKVMANIDVSDRRVPKDGRIGMKSPSGKAVELRVSIIPIYNGERLVIRILDKSSFDFSLSSLGIHRTIFDQFRGELEKPMGLILLTGPTGSGKTTTLYSMLSHLNDSSRSIVSIEDPVEFGFRGIGQIQVNERQGFNFAGALRVVLRQDPDVIMVGEIRDEETADICIRASLTGHLVLATMHTNDSATAIARLVSMGVKPYLVASSLNMAIAQRLLRKLCPQCKKPEVPNPRLLLKLGLKPQHVEKLKFQKGAGCAACNFSGYKGRLGVFEIMFTKSKLRELIAANANTEVLKKRAKTDKIVSLSMDGLYKAKESLTTVEELMRHTIA